MLRLVLGCGVPPGRRFLGVFEEDGEVGTVTYNSAVAASHTGNTNETTLATVTIPGGLLQANSVIEIYALFKCSDYQNGVYTGVYFGGTKYMDDGFNGGVSHQTHTVILCNNSLTAQKGFPSPGINNTVYGAALITSSVNTANDVNIVFKGQLEVSNDSVTLEGYRIKLNGV